MARNRESHILQAPQSKASVNIATSNLLKLILPRPRKTFLNRLIFQDGKSFFVMVFGLKTHENGLAPFVE